MFPKLTPINKNIIIACAVLYVISNFVETPDLYQLLSAYYPQSPNFHSWQIITHMFMHAPMGEGIGITHILFNMLTLWSFGPVLEQSFGSKKFSILYFASGLGAFVLFNLWNFYGIHQLSETLTSQGIDISEIYRMANLDYGDVQEFQNNPYSDKAQLFWNLRSPMLGASGAIFGVVSAFSTLFPEAKLMFMFVPFPIKAKYLFPIIIIVSLFLGFNGQIMGNIAHFAHIGGAVVGFLIALSWKKRRFY
ncbi:MAG: rhomboid family intramembrane serine protease [Flavobacteriaceae bacterium]|jgi:membrane associated rhomboid family serine protease|nr:rhomboid family intramembrane serine protease [Flavobacteriaceae bacterium]